nr:MerC domain-containing protein [Sphingosinicella sp. CPCC 101087]
MRVIQGAIRSEAIDRLAIGLSGLCLVHCIASAVLLAVLASAGGLLLDPIVHELGMMLALGLGIVGLGRGILAHGFMLPAAIGSLGLGIMAGALTLDHDALTTVYSVAGVLILALGHDLNRRAVI